MRRDHRLEQLVADRRKRYGDPWREYERKAASIRAEGLGAREEQRKLDELRDEMGVA